jgi:hypothetical protein
MKKDDEKITEDLREELASSASIDEDSIDSLTLSRDLDTGGVLVQFYLTTSSHPGDRFGDGLVLYQLVKTGNLTINLSGQWGELWLTTDCRQAEAYLWTDNAPCPDRPCENGGRCGQRSAGDYYCHCINDWTGEYCHQRDFFPLFLLPVVLGILMLLLLLTCCCCMCCCSPGGARQVEVVEEVEEVPCEHEIEETIRDEHVRQLPQQTYYHAIGRSFPVVFNDRSFNRPSIANSERYYGSLGKRMTVNFAGYNSVPHKSHSEIVTMTPRPAESSYYDSIGRQRAMAYNGQSFGGARHAHSVLLNQPF